MDLRWTASRSCVQICLLRSLVGIWIYGALVRREVLAVAHHVFKFMDEYEGLAPYWWRSARDEVLAMPAGHYTVSN